MSVSMQFFSIASSVVSDINVVDVVLNFLAIMVYMLLFSLSEGYTLGLTMENFFTNKIADAKKRQAELDNEETNIKNIIERLRYRVTGGLWKLIFKIFCFPGWLIGCLINLLVKGIALLVDFLFIRNISNRSVQKVVRAILTTFNSVFRFVLHLLVYIFISVTVAEINSVIEYYSAFELLVEGELLNALIVTVLPFGLTFIQMVIYTGMLCPNMMKIGFIEKFSDKLDDAGEKLYDKYWKRSTIHNVLVGSLQNVIGSISDFLRSMTFWREFTKDYKWIFIIVPICLLDAFVYVKNGTGINTIQLLSEQLGIVDNLIVFIRGWITLFVIKIVLVKFPSFVLRIVKPETYVKLMQTTEKISISCIERAEKIDNVVMKPYNPSNEHFSNADRRSAFEKYKEFRKSKEDRGIVTGYTLPAFREVKRYKYRLNTDWHGFQGLNKDDRLSIIKAFLGSLKTELQVDDGGFSEAIKVCSKDELYKDIYDFLQLVIKNKNDVEQDVFIISYAIANICGNNEHVKYTNMTEDVNEILKKMLTKGMIISESKKNV